MFEIALNFTCRWSHSYLYWAQ